MNAELGNRDTENWVTHVTAKHSQVTVKFVLGYVPDIISSHVRIISNFSARLRY